MKKVILAFATLVAALTFATVATPSPIQSNGDPGGGGTGSTCNYFTNGAVLYLPLAPPPYGATTYRCRINSGPAWWTYSDYYQSVFVNWDQYNFYFTACCLWGWVPYWV